VLAGRFRIIRRIGRGSFGNVYEAQDLQLEERVALKLLRPEVRDNPGLLGHLHHEIVVGRRVSHPNVCRIYDLGTCDDLHFISMALVAGDGLDRYLEKGLPPIKEVHTILVQICEALEAAHNQGVVHRDLKPSNIMIQPQPNGDISVTVMDFGLSRDLRAGPSMSGVLVGSPAYWSPEQARGERATTRSDIYSLGLIACDMFGVKHPAFGTVTGLETVPAAYRAVLERCLRPGPAERYCSARDVRISLIIASKAARIRRQRVITIVIIGLAAVGGAASVPLFTLLRTPRRGSAAVDGGAPAQQAHGGRDLGAPVTTVALRERSHAPGRFVRRGTSKRAKPWPGHAVSKANPQPTPAPPPDPVPPPTPTPTPAQRKAAAKADAIAALNERLARFGTERHKRGVLIDDLPGARGQRDDVKRALAAGQEAPAASALGRLEEGLRQLKIDGSFVSRKLERLNRTKRGMQLPEETDKKVSAIFAKVHESFFSGDYEGANAQLNSIWRLLGRGD
jgi:serine/threonine protein kinase